VQNIKTDAAMLKVLERAAGGNLSAEEIHRQRVSFIMGSLAPNSAVTRAKVEEVLVRQAGGAAKK